MYQFIIFTFTFWMFFFIFTFIFSNIIYSLFYSLPRSIVNWLKGALKLKSVIICLIPIILWTCVYFGMMFLLGFLAAWLNWEWLWDVLNSTAIILAFYGVIIILVGKLILKKYRSGIRDEYYQGNYFQNLSEKGSHELNHFADFAQNCPFEDLKRQYIKVLESDDPSPQAYILKIIYFTRNLAEDEPSAVTEDRQ